MSHLENAKPGQPLTRSELQAARALIDHPELTIAELAPLLKTTEQVVKNTARRIYRKTATTSRLHLLDWAYKTGAKRVPQAAP